MDASYIIYTGIPLTYIDTDPGDNLQVILGNINTAVNTMNPAPDYTPYDLQCLRPTYTITDTQEFAEAVSSFICTLRSDFDDFVDTTYVADQTVITAAIAGFQVPALTYAAFSITNTDTVTQVWNKSFTGFTAIINSILPTSASWVTLGASAQTTIVGAFNTIIAYEVTQDTAIATKQASLGTFNTSSIGGGASTAPITTINQLITKAAALPTYNYATTTWGCVTPGTTLQTAIDNTVAAVTGTMTNYVNSAGTGLQLTSPDCAGREASVDDTWIGLYKVAIDSTDATNGDSDYLENKITSLDGSITIDTTTNPDKLDLAVTIPVDNKVKVNSSDITAGYLVDKIAPTTSTDWGIIIYPTPTVDNSQVELNASIDPEVFIYNILNIIATDPTLLAKFCSLITACDGCLCDTIDDLLVAIDIVDTEFDLSWTPTGGSTTAQIAKYRESTSSTWLTGNFTPANPLSNVATTTTASGLLTNTKYQFQVDSQCPGDVSNSNIYEAIIYEEQALDTEVNPTRVVSVSQNPMTTVDVVQYRLVNQNTSVVLETISTTGISPSGSFATAPAATYKVQWRAGTLINGVTLYSDDSSQENAWYEVTGIIVA